MAKQIIAVEDTAPGACTDVGMHYNGIDTITSSSKHIMSSTLNVIGDTTVRSLNIDDIMSCAAAVSFGSEVIAPASGILAISETMLITCCTTNSTADLAATLADGVDGQIKIVKLILKDTNNLVITPISFDDGSTITLDASGELVVLVYTDAGWQLIYTNGTVA